MTPPLPSSANPAENRKRRDPGQESDGRGSEVETHDGRTKNRARPESSAICARPECQILPDDVTDQLACTEVEANTHELKAQRISSVATAQPCRPYCRFQLDRTLGPRVGHTRLV